MPSIFPFEIEEMVLDFLAEDDKGHSALKVCSLVCQAFLHICRKHIFRSIVLNDHNRFGTLSSPTTCAFERLLRETPEIADYIRKLDYTIQAADLTSPSLQESLKPISRLEFLAVRHRRWPTRRTSRFKFDWSNNPIRPALLHLLHLPTLTHFTVSDHIKNFAVSDLISCVNLKCLNIGNFTTVTAENTFPASFPEHSIQPNEFIAGIGTSAAYMNLCTARLPDGRPIIDFGSLSKITVDIQDHEDGEASQKLFNHCHVLTNVHITFSDLPNVRPSFADMLRPSMQTLKHIIVNVEVDDVGVDPLFGIPSELDHMRTKNIIETIAIRIKIETQNAGCRRGDDWGRLDEVLTSPGWFSLKRVLLAIQIPKFYEINNELEVALRSPETQFPRLTSSNRVSFDIDVI